MTSFDRALVAHKRTTFERYNASEDPTLAHLIASGDISVGALRRSHDTHYRSLQIVVDHLEAHGLPYETHYRGDVDEVSEDQLVIAVGGDGTVLDLSHRLADQPLLAINSDPTMSFGYFCAGAANEFEMLLERTVNEEWDPIALFRFGVLLNGERVGPPILNDILVAHANPAAVTSYILRVGEAHDEPQKSSGIWISTAAGSTAAIRSAGGYVLPLDSLKIQYLVREPCPPTLGLYRQVKGIRDPADRFEVISKMPEGKVYLDGCHLDEPFPVGTVLTVSADVPPLRIYGISDKIRE